MPAHGAKPYLQFFRSNLEDKGGLSTTTAMRMAQRTAPEVRTPIRTADEATPRDVAPLGQAAALSAISAFLDSATRKPTGLVIEGETGAGKSTLFQAGIFEARTRGVRVLAAHLTESESGLAFAGLGDLLDGTLDAQSGLPSPQLRALRVAALLEDPGPTPPDQRAVSVAVLTLIRSLAARSPVLVRSTTHRASTPRPRA